MLHLEQTDHPYEESTDTPVPRSPKELDAHEGVNKERAKKHDDPWERRLVAGNPWRHKSVWHAPGTTGEIPPCVRSVSSTRWRRPSPSKDITARIVEQTVVDVGMPSGRGGNHGGGADHPPGRHHEAHRLTYRFLSQRP